MQCNLTRRYQTVVFATEFIMIRLGSLDVSESTLKWQTSDCQCSDWQWTLSHNEALTDFYSIVSHEDWIVPNTIRKLDTLLTYANDSNMATGTKQKKMEIYITILYHRFRWYATLENKTPTEMFPKFPPVLRVIDRSDQNPPITATSVTFGPSLSQASGLWLVDFDPICR